MSGKTMYVITAVMELFMRLLVAVCVSNFVLHGFMAYEKFQAWNTLYIIVPVTGFFLARRFLYRHTKMMVTVHLLLLFSVVPMVHSSAEDAALVFVVTLLFMGVSLKQQSQAPLIPVDVGLILTGFILSDTLKSDSAAVIPAYSMVAYVICFFIYLNMKNINAFLAENAHAKSFKSDQALNVNTVMMAAFMLFCMLAMFIAPRLHIQDGVAVVGRAVLSVLVWLFRKIDMPTGGLELELEHNSKPSPADEGGGGMLMFGINEGSVILDTIAAVIGVVLALCMIVLLVKAIRRIRFEKISGTDVKEFIKPEFYNIHTEKDVKKKFFDYGMNNNERARRKYKKFVMKNKGRHTVIAVSAVPDNITRLAGGNDIMTQVYEKARYGNEMVTDEELKSLL